MICSYVPIIQYIKPVVNAKSGSDHINFKKINIGFYHGKRIKLIMNIYTHKGAHL